ncbi:hypothetical protein BDR03DRAFT_987041 [Suillus americanus]|nr:hypothetical protein BDR03DRAFT_987041 [Suillus americanus]
MSSSSELTSSNIFLDPSLHKPSLREPSSAPPTPPTSDAHSSSPAKSNSESPAKNMPFILLHPEATVEEAPALQVDESNCDSIVHSPADSKHRGNRDEDDDLPTKRFRALKTTWNHTHDSETTNYLNEHMLELSRITHWALAARVCYQCLHAHKLDLIKSILEEETELSQKQINGIDLQIGSIRNMLQDGGVRSVGNKGCKFDPSDRRSWCESSVSVSDDDGLMFGSDATLVSLSDE